MWHPDREPTGARWHRACRGGGQRQAGDRPRARRGFARRGAGAGQPAAVPPGPAPGSAAGAAAGAAALAAPAEIAYGGTNTADIHRLFLLRQPMTAVQAFLEGHLPAGMRSLGPGQPAFAVVTIQARIRASSRQAS
jgi:hypothetical protein